MNINEFKDYYKILHVGKDASFDEINRQRKKIAFEYHPDMCFNSNSIEYEYRENKMKELNEAYDVLKNESSRKKYDELYDKYYAEIRRREKRNNRENSQQRKNRRASYGYSATYDEYEKDYETNFEYFKRIYNEAKEEEKANPFRRRHHNLSRNMNKNRQHGDIPYEIVVNLGHGIIHISYELCYQLHKFTTIKEDTVPKYIIRNRKSIGTIILASTIAFAGLGGHTNDSTNVSGDTRTTISTEDDSVIESSMENSVENITNKMNSKVCMMRYYKLRGGDTLSQLAEEWEMPLSTIEKVNDISNSNLVQMGQVIKIPYNVYERDLEFYSKSVVLSMEQLKSSNVLEELANDYYTDVETLYNLNPESIKKSGTSYTLESDSLIAPVFAKRSEVILKKDEQSTKQSTKQATKQ